MTAQRALEEFYRMERRAFLAQCLIVCAGTLGGACLAGCRKDTYFSTAADDSTDAAANPLAAVAPTIFEPAAVKVTVTRTRCNGCGRCLRACANRAIAFSAGKALINQTRCTQCLSCVSVCRRQAIRVQKR